jgi:hypothetical protein
LARTIPASKGECEVWLKDPAIGAGEQEVAHTDAPKRAVSKREDIILGFFWW